MDGLVWIDRLLGCMRACLNRWLVVAFIVTCVSVDEQLLVDPRSSDLCKLSFIYPALVSHAYACLYVYICSCS